MQKEKREKKEEKEKEKVGKKKMRRMVFRLIPRIRLRLKKNLLFEKLLFPRKKRKYSKILFFLRFTSYLNIES